MTARERVVVESPISGMIAPSLKQMGVQMGYLARAQCAKLSKSFNKIGRAVQVTSCEHEAAAVLSKLTNGNDGREC